MNAQPRKRTRRTSAEAPETKIEQSKEAQTVRRRTRAVAPLEVAPPEAPARESKPAKAPKKAQIVEQAPAEETATNQSREMRYKVKSAKDGKTHTISIRREHIGPREMTPQSAVLMVCRVLRGYGVEMIAHDALLGAENGTITTTVTPTEIIYEWTAHKEQEQ